MEEIRRIWRPPVILTAAVAARWNPNLDAAVGFDVWFNCVNTSQTNGRIVQVGIDVARTAALTHHWFYETINPRRQSGWLGPFRITGADQLMAGADAAVDVVFLYNVDLIERYAVGTP